MKECFRGDVILDGFEGAVKAASNLATIVSHQKLVAGRASWASKTKSEQETKISLFCAVDVHTMFCPTFVLQRARTRLLACVILAQKWLWEEDMKTSLDVLRQIILSAFPPSWFSFFQKQRTNSGSVQQ